MLGAAPVVRAHTVLCGMADIPGVNADEECAIRSVPGVLGRLISGAAGEQVILGVPAWVKEMFVA